MGDGFVFEKQERKSDSCNRFYFKCSNMLVTIVLPAICTVQSCSWDGFRIQSMSTSLYCRWDAVFQDLNGRKFVEISLGWCVVSNYSVYCCSPLNMREVCNGRGEN